MRIKSVVIWALAAAVAGFVAGCGEVHDDPGTPDGPVADTPRADTPPGQLSCASYCSSMMTNCTNALQQYASMTDCMSTCTRFPAGTTSDLSGNTLGCRTYHAGAAGGDPTVHCRHAGPGGSGVCGADCEGFCGIALASCTGANAQYSSMAACMTTCANYATSPPYASSVQSGNSLACRLYHATVASSAPNTHCAHTASTSGPCQ